MGTWGCRDLRFQKDAPDQCWCISALPPGIPSDCWQAVETAEQGGRVVKDPGQAHEADQLENLTDQGQ